MTIQHIADTLRAKYGRMRAHVKAHDRWSQCRVPVLVDGLYRSRRPHYARFWGDVADLLKPEET